ncbi:hypothetical protein ACHAXR_007484 [Thalassiosira sp. AJA248-18]
MASTKRLLKERANIARKPIPYVTFHDDDDDSMTDEAAGTSINEWRFVLALDPAHDSPDDASEIGKAADSPYCHPPASSGKKLSGLLSGVTRAAKSSKKSSSDLASSSSSGGPAYFAFQLDFPPNYPFKAPTITVLSKSYHPNIKQTSGEICDSVLTGEDWGPTLNVRKICARLRKFLCDPDPDHPLESDIAQLLVEKPGDYASAAFKHAAEHATKAKAEDAMAKGKLKK